MKAEAPDTTPAQAATEQRLRDSGAGRAGRPGRNRGNAAGRAPATVYVIVLAGCAAGLIWVWQGGSHGTKGGTLTVAGAMFVAALARLVLPESRAGMLASRKRLTDVLTLMALAAGLLAAGLLLSAPV